MKNEEILRKAIEKAVKNGYAFEGDWNSESLWWVERGINRIIFSHSFAKAFWGEVDMWKETECTCGGVDFHLGGYDMHKMNCKKI